MNEARHFSAFEAHLKKSDVELYVINALAMDRAAEVEEHVACCEACADALAHEAQLEMALEIVAERVVVMERVSPSSMRAERVEHAAIAPSNVVRIARRPARVARAGLGLAAAMAAAAAMILWLAPSTKADAGADDVAKLGAVSADAAGAIVSFDHAERAAMDQKMDKQDKLDGG